MNGLRTFLWLTTILAILEVNASPYFSSGSHAHMARHWRKVHGPGILENCQSFVTREGTSLKLDGYTFRAVGPNIYWLGLDENQPEASTSDPKPPTHERVDEAMAIAVAMGANTIRSTSLGVSVGKPITIHPDKHEFVSSHFEPLDYAVYAAKIYGIRLIIPLVDNFKYYHGGKFDFLNFYGVSDEDYGNLFYTDEKVLRNFKKYIIKILHHRNTYTGVKLKDEPSILGWQIGNELGGWQGMTGWPPYSFVQDIARHIKHHANQLVVSPECYNWNYTTDAIAPSLLVDEIDIIDQHFYPIDNKILTTTLAMANYYNKVYVAGETDWTKDTQSTSLDDFLQILYQDGNAGMMLWSVFGHDSNCKGYVRHDDGYSVYCDPDGNPVDQQIRINKFVRMWYRMTGRQAPRWNPRVTCPQPNMNQWNVSYSAISINYVDPFVDPLF